MSVRRWICLLAVFSSSGWAKPIYQEKLASCAQYQNLPEKRFSELARQQITVEGHVFSAVLDRRIEWFDDTDHGEEQTLRLTIISDKKKSRRYFIGNRITKCSDRWMPYLSVENYMGKDFLVMRTASAWLHYGDGNPPPIEADVEIRVLEITPKGAIKRRLYTQTRLECFEALPCSVHLEKMDEEGKVLALVWESTDGVDREKHVVHYKWTKNCWAEVLEDTDKQSTIQKWSYVCFPEEGFENGNDDTSLAAPKFANPKKWL